MDGTLGQTATVAWVAFRGSLRGARALGLVAIALIPTLVEVALVAGKANAQGLADAAESQFATLMLSISVIVVTLVIAVGQFRTEIEDDTLSYLWSRSIPRANIALGKFLGAMGAIWSILVPLSLVPLGVAVAAGAPSPPPEVAWAILSTTVLAGLAYGAFFLFLGLVTRSALLIGLLFGFLWEHLLLLLPGSVPKFTVVFYLRSLASDLVSSGPLSGFPMAVPTTSAVAALLSMTVVFVALTVGVVRFVEIAPQRATA